MSPSNTQQAHSTTTKPTIYFGYGSNLWLSQMSQRCPTSKYLGVARLNGYKWIINDRGYANVVDASNSTNTPATNTTNSAYNNAVFGLVYSLEPEDEAKLDKNEGVPIAYTKELLACDFWSAGQPSNPTARHTCIDTRLPPKRGVDMLVYIDRQRTTPDEPRKEYIYRMNQGIADAVELGVPREYVDSVMRKYVPEENEDGDGEVGRFAREQAKGFRDESGVFR